MNLPPIGEGAPLVFVAGPCVAESLELLLRVAEGLSNVSKELGFSLIFKASFDKANRTRGDAFRGPGLELGLAWLAQVKAQTGLPLLVDVHEPHQCAVVAEVADILQVPAFLCRQTDLLNAAARTGRVVNVKRGQFLDPRDARFALEKAGPKAWLTERGTAFGHGDLVFDPRSLFWLKETGAPVLFDCTHSAQRPGGGQGETGGDRRLVRPLARAAVALGVDGLYAEVHPEPALARSDAATQLDLPTFAALAREALAFDAVRRSLLER